MSKDTLAGPAPKTLNEVIQVELMIRPLNELLEALPKAVGNKLAQHFGAAVMRTRDECEQIRLIQLFEEITKGIELIPKEVKK